MTDENLEYRLSFETIDPHTAMYMETDRGKSVWVHLGPKEWDDLPWSSVARITTDPWQQYNTLKKWAEVHTQPIRNVKLEKRPAPLPDEGWEEVE